ncbi:copper resistance CopC family protein [Corynebacterium glutamicum]|uniref:copper resistance CopC family protein n=1 Tax=Corynebacterium glutamicum TaxID=1718 RepID=UPI0004E27B13|nr:copper resistance protein CopC [Corynebacterium glutamicum]
MNVASEKNLKLRTLVAAAGVLGVGAMSMLVAPQAAAHDVVVDSNPENGSVVDEFPETIELEFSGIPQDLFTTVALSNADSGEVLTSGTPQLDGQHLSYEVPSDVQTGAGNYILGFQITSSDGHATKGSISFEVTGSAEMTTETTTESAATTDTSETTEAETTETADETSGIPAPWNWVLSIVAVLVVASVIVMMIAKNRNQK